MSITIGIIRTSSIGDVVLATACLDYMHGIVPQENVVWVGRQPTLDLIKSSWSGIEALELKTRPSAADYQYVQSKLEACNVIVDLQNSFMSRRLCRSLKSEARTIVTVKKQKLRRLRLVIEALFRGRLIQLPSTLSNVPKFQYQMMIDAIRSALEQRITKISAGKDESRPKLHLRVNESSENILWRDMSFGKWMAIAPGASHQPKRAPAEVFRDVLTHLGQILPKEQAALGLVYLGSDQDRHAANQLIDELVWQGPVLNLAGKLTLEQSALVLGKTTVLLSNDSGLTHIAEAVGVPVAVLFGPTVEAFGFAPWRIGSRAHSAKVGCRPCSRHGKRKCRFGDQLCFHSIDTKAVARHLSENIGGN